MGWFGEYREKDRKISVFLFLLMPKGLVLENTRKIVVASPKFVIFDAPKGLFWRE